MKKQKIIWIVGVVTLIVIGVIVALLPKQSDQGLMTKAEAKRRVEILEERATVPLDEETRQNINRLIQEIGRETGVVDVNGTKVSVSTVGVWGLRKIGKAAIPELIDAATSGRNMLTRQLALGTTKNIYIDCGNSPMELLPLFALSICDKEGGVRGTATAQIGRLALEFTRPRQEEQLDILLPYLRKALSDRDDSVKYIGAMWLYQIDKQQVPIELVERYSLDKHRYD